ncbi:MAG: hypothetical protein ACKV2V_05690 [Blastocatellia bacterium]
MEIYRPRKVVFHQALLVGEWRVKVYTITCRAAFMSPAVRARWRNCRNG